MQISLSLVYWKVCASLRLVLGGLLEAPLPGRSPVRPLIRGSTFALPALMLGSGLTLLVRSSAHPPDSCKRSNAVSTDVIIVDFQRYFGSTIKSLKSSVCSSRCASFTFALQSLQQRRVRKHRRNPTLRLPLGCWREASSATRTVRLLRTSELALPLPFNPPFLRHAREAPLAACPLIATAQGPC